MFLNKGKKTLRTGDGRVLDVKEAVVINEDGSTAHDPFKRAHRRQGAEANTHIRVWKGGWFFGLLIFLIVPLLLVAGFTVIGFIIAVSLAVWLLRSIIRAFRI